MSRHEGSPCGSPAWAPPRLTRPGGLPRGPCAWGSPAEGGARSKPASRAPLPGSLEARGRLWSSGWPSGLVCCGPWGRGERTQHQATRCAGRTEGPPKPPRPREPPAPASTPVPGDTLAARACRRGWACSAGSTGSGGCRGGAGGGCRPGSRPPDPPGSPRSAKRWVGGFHRTPGPPLQGRGRRDPPARRQLPGHPRLTPWDPGDTGGAAQARRALSRLLSPSEHPG